MKYARILAIESATGPTSVAVWDNGRISAYLEDASKTMQSARLIPMVHQALKQSGIGFSQFDALACTVGPGSFTGIRVALAAARGICFAAHIPGLGYTTLEVLAHGARKQQAKSPIRVAISAGKGQYYLQDFTDTQAEPIIANPDAIQVPEGGLLVTTEHILDHLQGPSVIRLASPRADLLAEMAAAGIKSQSLSPFYIRPPDAIPPTKFLA
ncbi:MAG: tRNA (adenosine(37)-N6)-threonylcarbamoyltransferase complex dimerization subunit type 1 TsaB [Rickettsiales bacterium]|nr:tRNA (adenosine(37)-N6)-threonylcarbamoyltransferase complex dimerization subunit type 1 TsaB [Rickettsiales bacterium]